jgi:hypothetical protein
MGVLLLLMGGGWGCLVRRIDAGESFGVLLGSWEIHFV